MFKKGGLYIAMGDSWTWAVNTSTTRGEHFYATKLRNAIRKDYGNVRLINKGIGGVTADKMIQNLPWMMNLEPDLVTIGVGTNDCVNGGSYTGVEGYKDELRILIDAIRAKKQDVIIIFCTPGRTLDPNRQPYIQEYRDGMIAVATEKNIPVCHFENAWTNDSANLEADLIHPNAKGQDALFNTLYPVIKRECRQWLAKLEK